MGCRHVWCLFVTALVGVQTPSPRLRQRWRSTLSRLRRLVRQSALAMILLFLDRQQQATAASSSTVIKARAVACRCTSVCCDLLFGPPVRRPASRAALPRTLPGTRPRDRRRAWSGVLPCFALPSWEHVAYAGPDLQGPARFDIQPLALMVEAGCWRGRVAWLMEGGKLWWRAALEVNVHSSCMRCHIPLKRKNYCVRASTDYYPPVWKRTTYSADNA